MNIYGERIVLRAISMDDANLLLNLINDPNTEKMLGGSSFPVSMESQKDWILKQSLRDDVLRCIIALKENEKEGLGTIILSDIDRYNGTAQVHIKMNEKSRGKGYGSEAIKTIVKYAFDEMRLNCIYAEVLSYNNVSQKLFEKTGFLKEGILKSRIYKNDSYIDLVSYSITK